MKKVIVVLLLLFSFQPVYAGCPHLDYLEVQNLSQTEFRYTFEGYRKETMRVLLKSLDDQQYVNEVDQCKDELTRMYRLYGSRYGTDNAKELLRY